VYEAIANWVLLAAAVVALVLTLAQIRQNAGQVLRAEGWRLWSDHLRLGFDNPWFGSTALFLQRANQKEFSALWRQTDNLFSAEEIELREKYSWFLINLLNAAEALLAGPHATLWHAAIREQLRLHRTALKVLWFEKGWSEQFHPKLGAIVRDLLSVDN